METTSTRMEKTNSKVSFIGSFLNKVALILVLAICSAPMAMAQDHEFTPAEVSARALMAPAVVTVDVVKPADTQVKIAAQSIINMMSMMESNAQRPSVKVPSYNYLAVLQELQNRHAKFLLPGAAVPATAHVVFQLESEQAGMSQTVYF